ncbi:hypothetical protein HAX54_009339, partial [Datura stramonium]|nr:hypothetical protein [Datura stramonium]
DYHMRTCLLVDNGVPGLHLPLVAGVLCAMQCSSLVCQVEAIESRVRWLSRWCSPYNVHLQAEDLEETLRVAVLKLYKALGWGYPDSFLFVDIHPTHFGLMEVIPNSAPYRLLFVGITSSRVSLMGPHPCMMSRPSLSPLESY